MGPVVPYTSSIARVNARRAAPFVLSSVPSMSNKISFFMVKRLLVALPLAGVGALWFFYLSLPWPILLRSRNPERTAFIHQRIEQAESRGDSLRIRKRWVPLARISNNLKRAVIVAED